MNIDGPDHPFYSWSHDGRHYYACSADDRLQRIKSMDAEELRKVLDLPDLQHTVRRAADARLRRVERGGGRAELFPIRQPDPEE